MRKTIAFTLLCSLIFCFALCAVSYACSGYNNTLSAERYSYPGDGDDAYASTYGTSCGTNWSNTVSVSLQTKYQVNGVNYWSSPVSDSNENSSVASVSNTVTSDTGIMAASYHTNYCKRCSQYLCQNLGRTDYF